MMGAAPATPSDDSDKGYLIKDPELIKMLDEMDTNEVHFNKNTETYRVS